LQPLQRRSHCTSDADPIIKADDDVAQFFHPMKKSAVSVTLFAVAVTLFVFIKRYENVTAAELFNNQCLPPGGQLGLAWWENY